MIENLEYKGIWYLPAETDLKRAGTLKFSPDEGISLSLIDPLGQEREERRLYDFPIILGITSSGERITLWKCKELKKQTPPLGPSTLNVRVEVLFVGVHFQSTESVKFRALWIQYELLDAWVSASGFMGPRMPMGRRVEIVYQRPQPIRLIEIGDVNVTIEIDYEYHYELFENSIRQETSILLETKAGKHFDEYDEHNKHIQNLLTLAIGEVVYPISVRGEPREENGTEISANRPSQVRIYYQSASYHTRKPPVAFASMLFTLDNVRNRIAGIFQLWFDKKELLEPVYELYFGVLYNRHLYIHNTFLSLAQAVETYHRRMKLNALIPKEEYEQTVAEIIEAVPEKYKDWLAEGLQYGNEPNLRSRIISLLGEFSESLNEIFPSRSRIKSFANKTTVTRNYLTHYSPDSKAQAAHGEDLREITRKLEILLVTCLLKELEFSDAAIKETVNRRIKFRGGFLLH